MLWFQFLQAVPGGPAHGWRWICKHGGNYWKIEILALIIMAEYRWLVIMWYHFRKLSMQIVPSWHCANCSMLIVITIMDPTSRCTKY